MILYGTGDERVRVQVRGALGRRRLPHALRGRHQLHDAPHARDAVRGHAAVLPALPLQPALLGLRRPAHPHRGPGREDRAAATSPRPPRSRSTPRLDFFDDAGPEGRRGQDRRGAAQGDPLAPALPARRRPRLPDPGPSRAVALRRRGPAHPPGQPDRQRADRRHLRARRAVDRPAPARQPEAAERPPAPARHRQHGGGGGARPRGHGGGGLARRLRPRRGPPRRRDRGRGHAGGGHGDRRTA